MSGPQGGFHMELGMEVDSAQTNVAWRIDLYDAATGDLVGTVGQTVFGDGTAQTADFACALAGTTVEARGWAAPLDPDAAIPTESTAVTLRIVAGTAPAC